ncbi:transposase [Streptococcus agalactiae]|uniref:transposase n=1 Tax=Streptococcus agalactiae TaxID=1311 RepID=UPI0024158142|nr:transposase [Streptococcus agalactiae]
MEQFKTIYRAINVEEAKQALDSFINEWKPHYKKVIETLESIENLLIFYEFLIRSGEVSTRPTLLNHLTKKSNVKPKRKSSFPMKNP